MTEHPRRTLVQGSPGLLMSWDVLVIPITSMQAHRHTHNAEYCDSGPFRYVTAGTGVKGGGIHLKTGGPAQGRCEATSGQS